VHELRRKNKLTKGKFRMDNNGIFMSSVAERVSQAVERLTSPKDKYADIVFVLRSIRESY